MKYLTIGVIIKMSDLHKRTVTDHWSVKYEEASFPFIQKGWILPAGQWEKFDPFLLMAEDWFKRGAFSDHPHRGFQTITYVVDGRLEHNDNAGGRGILEPGDVQYMNAGKGARHAEEGVDDDIAHTLQLWLNLPSNLKNSDPFYKDVYSEQAPVSEFDGGKVKVFAGKVAGVEGPMNSLVPITMSEVSLEEGKTYKHLIPETHNAFLYVLSGEIAFGEEEVTLQKNGVATLSFVENGDENKPSELTIKSKSRRCKILVYSGEPFRENIVAYGPFVMNSMEEIQQAYRDYHEGKFGPEAK